jgi:hypothetical protein
MTKKVRVPSVEFTPLRVSAAAAKVIRLVLAGWSKARQRAIDSATASNQSVSRRG